MLRKGEFIAVSLLLIGLRLTGVVSAQEAVVEELYLDALAMIESGSDPHAKGRAGELGAWQFKPVTWGYTSELRRGLELGVHPFSAAANSAVARSYARTLLTDHSRRFVSAYARQPTPGELYAIWNLGFDGFQRRGSLEKCPALTRDAAQRLTNLLLHLPLAQASRSRG